MDPSSELRPDSSLTFATVIFQGRVEASRHISDIEATELKSEIMPRFAPLDFRQKERFGGLKVFPMNNRRIAIAYITDSKEDDQWGRPQLRADAAIFDERRFNESGRDVLMVRDFLAKSVKDNSPPGEMLNRFPKLDRFESSSSEQSDAYHSALVDYFVNLQRIRLEFLTDVISTFLSCEKIVLYAPNDSVLQEVVKFVFLVLPFRSLSALTFSEICQNPLDERSEKVVISEVPLEGIKLVKKSQPSIVDFASKTVTNGDSLEIAKWIVMGILADEWYTLDKVEQYEIVRHCITELLDKGNVPSIGVSNRLTEMKATVEKFDEWLNRFNKAGRKEGKR